jgi:hypothetical protein
MYKMMLFMVFYYMCRLQAIFGQMGANTTQIQQKVVKSRVGDELGYFKMEQT